MSWCKNNVNINYLCILYYSKISLFLFFLSVNIIRDLLATRYIIYNVSHETFTLFSQIFFLHVSHEKRLFSPRIEFSCCITVNCPPLTTSRQIWKFLCIVRLYYVQEINLYIASRAKTLIRMIHRASHAHSWWWNTFLSSTPARVNSSEDRGQVKAPTKWSLRTWEFSLSCLFCFSPDADAPSYTTFACSIRSFVRLWNVQSHRNKVPRWKNEEKKIFCYAWWNSFLHLYLSILEIVKACLFFFFFKYDAKKKWNVYESRYVILCSYYMRYISLCGLVKS